MVSMPNERTCREMPSQRRISRRARRPVRSLIAAASLEDWRDWALHVSNEAGDVIFVLPFGFVLGKPH
jgi:hypothetical protein